MSLFKTPFNEKFHYSYLFKKYKSFREKLDTKYVFAFCSLHRRNERLEELNIRLLEEKHQIQSLRCPLYTRPVPELSCVRNHDSSQRLRRSLSQRENAVVPTSHPQPARKSMEDYLAEMEQAVDKGLTRALEEVTTEFEPGSARTSTPKSTNKSSQDVLLEAQQEYAEILKKKYMI
ncbi:ankyrin repeat domain-containing protein 26-like [Marmota marmota marmota]|uniref:ankyrin repeat domain-containing protein 26-like n=1 Tax=Marmota marmota marmota TaxID=9994 RepID=UPI002092DF2C|nr:ankyrin repeat domain-containing protein 26-like [Marmota marmota marmota]